MSRPTALMLLAAAGLMTAEAPPGRDGDGAAPTPGQWETGTEIVAADIPGAPRDAVALARRALVNGAIKMHRACIDPSMAQRPPGEFLAGVINGRCDYQRFRVAGGRLDAAMTCTHDDGRPDHLTGTFGGAFGGSRFDITGSFEMRVPKPLAGAGDRITVTTRTRGKRVGDCSKAGERE